MPKFNSSYLDSWVIESATSTHVCHNKVFFTSIHQTTINIYVILPNQHRFTVEYVGTVELSADLVFNDVLYVPHLTYNLLSINALLKDSCYSVCLSEDTCEIQDMSRLKMIGKVKTS